MKFIFPYTERQKRVLESQARILHIAAGTKTGKSMAFFSWLVEGLLAGEPCLYIGPWFFRCRAGYDQIKNLLEPWIRARHVRCNEARLQIVSNGGGVLDFQSADNIHGIYGGNYKRVCLDEASRCPREIYPAALTVISGTGGRLRLASNTELGQKNWALAAFLRVQKMTPEERGASGEDCMTFPSGADGLVSSETIELMRTQMPEVLWRALYLGEILDSDVGLFRNLDKIFVGAERETPAEGVRYFMGLDLAKRQDYTSATVVDEQGHVRSMLRFTQLDWSLQIQKVAQLYRDFHCVRVVADSTGVGDPLCEQLEDLGLEVERYTFTTPSRKALIEELILATDNREYTIPQGGKFHIYRQELESFEFVLDGVTAKYAAPGHDDTTMSLALAVHAFRQERGALLGVLDWIKRKAREVAEGVRDKFGELIRKPSPEPVPGPKTDDASPVVITRDQWREWCDKNKAPACPHPECGSTATSILSGKIHCNDCGRDNGEDVPNPTRCTCEIPLLVQVGGHWHCNQCGWDEPQDPRIPVNGARRTQRDEQSSLLSAEKFGLGWGKFRRSGRG